MQDITDMLDMEWGRIAQSTKARRHLHRWRRRYGVFAGFVDLQHLLDHRRENPADAPAILTALARLAPHDPVAARTLLQVLVPGLVRLAVVVGGRDRDVDGELVSLAWERICTYPPGRRGSVAVNILADVRKRFLQQRPPEVRLTERPPEEGIQRSRSAEDEALEHLSLYELVIASGRRGVSRSALGLVLRTRVADTPLNVICAEEGVAPHTLRVRRCRAEKRLSETLVTV